MYCSCSTGDEHWRGRRHITWQSEVDSHRDVPDVADVADVPVYLSSHLRPATRLKEAGRRIDRRQGGLALAEVARPECSLVGAW